MNGFEIKVVVSGGYEALELYSGSKVSYNSIMNKIGNLSTREISHSNTFSIPKTVTNNRILNLNEFNYDSLARGLNEKFRAQTLFDGVKIGDYYLVINKTDDKDIKINLLDKSYDLLDKWRSITFHEILTNSSYYTGFPQSYQDQLLSLKEYEWYLDEGIAQIPSINGTPICWFPNTVNQVGDSFNTEQPFGGSASEEEGRRLEMGYLNPAQSRPIWNVYKFLEMVCLAFGYTISYGSEVNQTDLKQLGIVSPDANKSSTSTVEDRDFTIVNSSEILPIESYTFIEIVNGEDPPDLRYEYGCVYGSGVSGLKIVTPSSLLTSIPDAETLLGAFDGFFVSPDGVEAWKTSGCMITPDVVAEDTELTYEHDLDPRIGVTIQQNPGVGSEIGFKDTRFSLWKNASGNVAAVLRTTTDNLMGEMAKAPSNFFQSDFIGVVQITYYRWGYIDQSNYTQITPLPHLVNYSVREQYSEVIGDNINDVDEYVVDEGTTDLTFGAPRTKILELVSGILKYRGLILNINQEDETVLVTSYTDILNNGTLGNYIDLSDEFLPNLKSTFNTDFGKDFGKVLDIGLRTPFPGNKSPYDLPFTNGVELKYADSVEYLNSTYSDIIKLLQIRNPGFSEFLEVSADSLSLVKYISNITDRGIYNSDTSYLTNPYMNSAYLSFSNTDSATLHSWLDLIAKGVKVTAKFSLSVSKYNSIANNMDFPVYIQGLRGFFIVDEIKEYNGSDTITEIRLIKIPY